MKRSKPRRSNLGRVLVLYRMSHQMGVRELSKACGISAATLSRIERGHAMGAETLLRVWAWLLEPADATRGMS